MALNFEIVFCNTEIFGNADYLFTVWKLQNFSVTQILREIKVGQSRVSISAILTH